MTPGCLFHSLSYLLQVPSGSATLASMRKDSSLGGEREQRLATEFAPLVTSRADETPNPPLRRMAAGHRGASQLASLRDIFILCLCWSCLTPRAAVQNANWKQELRLAIRTNDVAKVATIFTKTSLPPTVTLDDNLVTPLHLASVAGSREVATWLLDQGATVDAATTEQGHTPLIIAAGSGRIDIVKLLLERSAKINHKDSAGLTPLLWAIHQDRSSVAEYMIRQGADINANANNGRSALMMAA